MLPNLNPTRQLLTPPMSPRKRRQALRESEDSEMDMTIEQYLISCDPYRTTTLPTPWPHPLQLRHAADLQTRLLPFNDGISALLKSHGVSGDTLFLPYHATKAFYPGGDQAVNLLYVFSTADSPMPRRLGPVKDALVRFLAEKRIHDIHIEIVNKDLVFNPSLFPLSPKLPIIVAFEKAKSRLVGILHEKLLGQWRVLCPFGVGATHAKARPALVVIVDPHAFACWHDTSIALKIELLEALRDENREDDFQGMDVEFLPGDLSSLAGGVSYGRRVNIGDAPEMGWSVGIKGDAGEGTLGGYVTLTLGDKTIPGVLTNYHVVRPSPKSNNSKALQNLDQHGRLGGNTVQIESLARNDHLATLSDLNAMIEGTKSRIREYNDKIKERELMGASGLPRLSQMIDVNQKSLHSLLEKRKIFENEPRLLGELMSTSGKAILGRKIIDWAFIKLDDPASCFKSNKMFAVPENHQPWQYDPSLGETLPEGSPLIEFGTLEKGGYYMKRGRSTGVTAGICHGAAACCNWVGNDALRYDHNGKQTDISRIVTEETIIMSKTAKQTETQQSSFAEPGDSGSFVVDIEGKICGVLYGSTSGLLGPPGENSYYANAGLVMNIRDLTNSIKLRTIASSRLAAQLGLPGQ